MDTEIWKDIKNDDTFQVSSFGNVRRTKSSSGKNSCKLIQSFKHKNGYVTVALWKNGKRNKHKLHRLVASTFIDNTDKHKIEIHHKNHNRSDNRIENLEWVTPLYNRQNKMPIHVKKCRVLMNLLETLKNMGLLRTDKNVDVSDILKKTKF